MTALALAAAFSFHFGGGVGLAHTRSDTFMAVEDPNSRPNGLTLSLEAQLDSERFFFASTLLFANMFTGSNLCSASLRAGVFLLATDVSPYVAVGAGWLNEQLVDGDLPPTTLSPDGLALIGEAGVAALRRGPHGRLNVYVQLLQPLFDAPPDPNHGNPQTRPVLAGGLRLLY